MKRSIFLILSIIGTLTTSYSVELTAQTITQTIKGHVFDIETREPLTGATVIVPDSEPLLGASTDMDGNFSIRRARLGRQSIKISYMGYESVVIPEVMVTSSKEVVLNVGLKPSLSEMEGITVKPDVRKDKPLNRLATVSARSFSVEETRRYAGSLDDPARLVSAFAGVSVGNVQDNAIIIRGNSPKGVSWRLEGVDIPTPHHFTGGNVAGGGIVTLFSSQMLSNSDFYTSAFPAEYSNALAGVFDMNLKTGNFEKRQYTFQIGTLGLDFASEGPLSIGSNASYVFNYRYSTLGLLTNLNIINTEQVFEYQDLSYKINIPTKKAGVFSLWGIGGVDQSIEPLETDSSVWETDWDRVSYDWYIALGATGLSHKYITGKNTFVKSTFAITGMKNRMVTARQDDALDPRPDLLANDQSGKISLSSSVNHRFSSKHTIEIGITYKRLKYNLDINSTLYNQPETYRNVVKEKDGSNMLEFYTQSSVHLTPKLTLNAGVNAGYFALNDAFSADPRFGLKWDVTPNQNLSIGYGKHSQMEDLKIYFVKDESSNSAEYPNKDLGLSKAHHLVMAYDWHINENLRLKAEPYVQFLYNIPGIADSSFSMINYKQEWAFDKLLENNSKGRNIGLDITFERFLNNNYYFLITSSLLSSRYQSDDGKWRNTRFNKSYSSNLLVGKEFFFKDNRKVLGVNARINHVAGERVSPVLDRESELNKRAIFDESQAFSEQLSSTTYVDLTATYRINRAQRSSVWALQIKNILGQSMPEGYNYNYKSRSVQLDKMVAVIPSLSYTIEF